MSRILSLALFVTLAAPAFGQGNVPGGGGDPGVDISVPSSIAADVGGDLTIPVSVTSANNLVNMVIFDVMCDTAQVSITGATPSAGIGQHIANNGLPPNCDIIIYPNQATILMLFARTRSWPTLESAKIRKLPTPA